MVEVNALPHVLYFTVGVNNGKLYVKSLTPTIFFFWRSHFIEMMVVQ